MKNVSRNKRFTIKEVKGQIHYLPLNFVELMCKNRSLAGQIEHWAKIGKIAEENPDLSYEFIKNILIAQEEAKAEKLQKIF